MFQRCKGVEVNFSWGRQQPYRAGPIWQINRYRELGNCLGYILGMGSSWLAMGRTSMNLYSGFLPPDNANYKKNCNSVNKVATKPYITMQLNGNKESTNL